MPSTRFGSPATVAATCWTWRTSGIGCRVPGSLAEFEQKWAHRDDPHCFSGVWRFHELLPFAPLRQCVTVGEGQTLLHASDGVARYVGVAPGRLASCSTRA